MTAIPYADPGRASFELVDTYTQQFLLNGHHPELAPARPLPLAINTSFAQFSVVGLNQAAKLAMATKDFVAAKAAQLAGTFSGVGTANDTITIAGVVYTLKAAPTTVANEVKIGASAAATAENLVAAINAGAGAGTNYGSLTVANPSVTAVADGAVVLFVARTPGEAGNAIAVSEDGTGFSFAGGATALAGGNDQIGVRALGVLAQAASLGGSGSANGQVWYSGAFNQDALVWDPSFTTDAQKQAAFDGAPTPTTIIVSKR